MLENVKIAIVGAGGMANYHFEGFTKGGAEVVAICDTSIDKAKVYAAEKNIKNYFSSLTDLINSSVEFNAVSIITPNKFHYPLVMEALKAGKNVYCEKPPALNAQEMEDMLNLAKFQNKLLMFNFNNRARPESIAMKRYIKEGVVGKINSAQALWIRRAGIPGFGGWFTNKALSGGGPVVDLPHMLDLALYFMDYPTPDFVLATTYDDFMGNPSFKGPWGIPDNKDGVCNVESACHGFITFKNGSCLHVRSSWAEMNEREVVSVTFQGSKAGGKVERIFDIDGLDETSHDSSMLFTEEFGNQVNRKIIHEKDETMGRVRNAENFILSLLGKEEPFNKPEEALILMKIIDGIFESSKTKQAVSIK